MSNMGSKRKPNEFSLDGTESKRNKHKHAKKSKNKPFCDKAGNKLLPFDYRYIVAPMVGASELPFRLLCRKYGAQLVYTPMMLASRFHKSRDYRDREFQTTSFDRPLVCHFAANDPTDFAKAAKLAEPYCDAIDLNLGCPQRTAYVGHFGSYLLDTKDRDLILSIIRAGVEAVDIPIFVKIRLLDTYEETRELLRQLYGAGATLVAVHARYRATFHRKGPGARDGPALLDQVQRLKEEVFPDKLLITNGNTTTYDDVVSNLELTKADGIMSAEGILDNPALYLGRLGNREDGDTVVEVKGGAVFAAWSQKESLFKKLSKIEKIERKLQTGVKKSPSEKEARRLARKSKIGTKISNFDKGIIAKRGKFALAPSTLNQLYETADDKVELALEYLRLARQYPTALRTVVFHTRRILKTELATFQMMHDCLSCSSVSDVERVVRKVQSYQVDPASFRFDVDKARTEKEALEQKRNEEGRRKEYEARMIRKAKREGLSDLDFYLRQGAVVPTTETVLLLKTLDKEQQLRLWKEQEHSQHCMTFHLQGECPRGRTCAFLHVVTPNKNTFDEQAEVAG